MTSSVKHKGADSILYNSVKGTLLTTGVLAIDTWFKIKAKGVAPAIPDWAESSVFKSPLNIGDQITLAAGDEVWPLTLTEVCKVDVEFTGEVGVIETTDSCDYPYMASIPDGFTNLTGSINTMIRFDEATDAILPVSQDLLSKFYDINGDDSEGTYTQTEKDDTDLLLQILLNKDAVAVGQVENWLITPAILSSAATNVALKDVDKADYSWTKGQGPASIYLRTVATVV